MAQDNFALALQDPRLFALLIENKAQLDKRTRKRVDQFINEMKEEAEKHNATQDALSMIEGYALWKIGDTLTKETFFRSAWHPDLPHAELDALYKVIRKKYEESATTAATKALRRVVDRHDK